MHSLFYYGFRLLHISCFCYKSEKKTVSSYCIYLVLAFPFVHQRTYSFSQLASLKVCMQWQFIHRHVEVRPPVGFYS